MEQAALIAKKKEIIVKIEKTIEAVNKENPKVGKALRNVEFNSLPTKSKEEFINSGNKLFVDLSNNLSQAGVKADNASDDLLNLMTYLKEEFGDSEAEEEFAEKCIEPAKADSITFEDIAGQKTLKEDLKKGYIYPITYPRLFPEKSKGVMLYGVPGGGKTLTVKAVSNSVGNSILYAPKSGELLGKYLGDVEKKIDSLFKCAAREAKKRSEKGANYTSIIFLDEFDSIAGSRSDDKNMARSVNALLQGMDGFGSSENVSVIAATNYPWVIDGAVLRRFSNQVFVDVPDQFAIEQIIIESLGKAYNLPNSDKYKTVLSQKDGVVTFNTKVFEYIKEYGRGCPIKGATAGGIIYAAKEGTETYVTREFFVDMIKSKLTADKNAEFVKDEIKKNLAAPRYELKENMVYNFGYSGSDINKMMSIATQNASFRAMQGVFKKHKEGPLKGFYVSDNIKNIGIDDVYVLTEEFKLKYSKQGVKKISVVPENDSTKVLNFSLCEEDVKDAIERYPSTIIAQDYTDLLRYAYHRKAPTDK